MERRLPYYMAYPMPFAGEEERRERIDYEYMRSMYPDTAKKLVPYIEDEADRMEYDGSMMFDEYPDRLQMTLMSRRVYDRVKKDGILETTDDKASPAGMEESGEEMRDKGSAARRDDDVWLRELIDVMMYQEIYKRRSDSRRYRSKYYPGAELRSEETGFFPRP